MKNLNINIDNDISYLLEQIGNNCKVENVDARAIVNNSDLETTFDDKRIITDTILKRGNYIKYNDLDFIALNEINDKRYNSYNKAIMRNCNYDIRFIIEKYLFEFPTIVESETSKLKVTNDMIKISTDKIIVTLPYTASSKLIKLNDRFISMNKAWEVESIDRTKKGLIELTCKSSLINNNVDDMKNEIANRYEKSIDRLKGNITAIKPFDIQPDIIEPEPIDPEEPEPTDPTEPEIPEGLIISGLDRFTIWDENELYTVNTDKPVKWSLDRTDYIMIESQTGNECIISSSSTSTIGNSVLRVELVDDPGTFTELLIKKFYQ